MSTNMDSQTLVIIHHLCTNVFSQFYTKAAHCGNRASFPCVMTKILEH